MKGSDMQKDAVANFIKLMEQKLAPKPKVNKSLVTGFPVACRRLTLDWATLRHLYSRI